MRLFNNLEVHKNEGQINLSLICPPFDLILNKNNLVVKSNSYLTFKVNLLPEYGEDKTYDEYELSQLKNRSLDIKNVGHNLKNNTVFNVYGVNAHYIKKTYTSGIIDDYSSFPLIWISS